jgi:hypothetical protein
MADQLIGTSGLLAIYVPEGTQDVYEPGPMRGRVIGAVRLINMPRRGKMEDYSCPDWDGSPRWPIGWPCQVVYAPDVNDCPKLRDHVDHLRPGTFRSYVKQFLQGPFRLEPDMQARLNRDFNEFKPIG